jgi:hypothetical protein
MHGAAEAVIAAGFLSAISSYPKLICSSERRSSSASCVRRLLDDIFSVEGLLKGVEAPSGDVPR